MDILWCQRVLFYKFKPEVAALIDVAAISMVAAIDIYKH